MASSIAPIIVKVEGWQANCNSPENQLAFDLGAGNDRNSPRIEHLKITLDGASWHFVEASGETVILVGLLELADPAHHVITSETVTFTVLVRGSRTP